MNRSELSTRAPPGASGRLPPVEERPSRAMSGIARTLLAGLLVAGLCPPVLRAQDITVSGVVVEAARSSWIGGAVVRLSGSRADLTDADGRFRFSGVAPGRHTLSVEAYGYRPWSAELVLRADTTLQVEMEPDPVLLDSLVVAAEDVTIKGKIVDRATGRRILRAQVTVYPGGRTEGANSGDFTLHDVPAGRATTVVAEALAYLPARIALITESDTTLLVELDPDSVGLRMLGSQAERLEKRSRSVPLATTSMSREDLFRREATPVTELLRGRVSERLLDRRYHRFPITRCLFIDDRKVWPEELETLYAGEVGRLEIFDRGRMIRVYTTSYLARLMGSGLLPGIIYNETGLGTVCY